jgi:hypothetical protein
MKRFRGDARVWWLAVALAVAAGCGPAVHNITMPSRSEISASPTEATIVVVQPSTRFGSVNLLDPGGRLVGQLSDRSHTLVRVPPGPLRLYAMVERDPRLGDRIDGQVEAGRIYFATISMRWGGINFLALNPRSHDDRWTHRDEYVSGTPFVEMDPEQLSLALGEIGDAAPLIERIDRQTERMDPAHLEERTVLATDGI